MAEPPADASADPKLHVQTGAPYVLSNLTSAVAGNIDMGLHAPGAARRTYYTDLRDRVAALSDPVASNAMWTSRPYSVCRLVMQVRYGTLNCPALADRQRRPYVAASRVVGAACPLCRHVPCTPGHILGGCAHRLLKPMYIKDQDLHSPPSAISTMGSGIVSPSSRDSTRRCLITQATSPACSRSRFLSFGC